MNKLLKPLSSQEKLSPKFHLKPKEKPKWLSKKPKTDRKQREKMERN